MQDNLNTGSEIELCIQNVLETMWEQILIQAEEQHLSVDD